jgi:hypothetical protein
MRNLYHATRHSAAETILTQGLRSGLPANFGDSRKGFVYLAERKEAEYYGGLLGGGYTLLEVNVAGLDLENDPQATKPSSTYRTAEAIEAHRVRRAV